MISPGVGRSGSPIPRSIRSIPFCLISPFFLSISAKRYGGICSTRFAFSIRIFLSFLPPKEVYIKLSFILWAFEFQEENMLLNESLRLIFLRENFLRLTSPLLPIIIVGNFGDK